RGAERRDREQERELRGGAAVETRGPAAEDRRRGARETRPQRGALREPDRGGLSGRDLVRGMGAGGAHGGLDHEDEHRAGSERERDRERREQVLRDGVVEEE